MRNYRKLSYTEQRSTIPREVREDVLAVEAVDSGQLREVCSVSAEHVLPWVEQHIALNTVAKSVSIRVSACYEHTIVQSYEFELILKLLTNK